MTRLYGPPCRDAFATLFITQRGRANRYDILLLLAPGIGFCRSSQVYLRVFLQFVSLFIDFVRQQCREVKSWERKLQFSDGGDMVIHNFNVASNFRKNKNFSAGNFVYRETVFRQKLREELQFW